MKSILHFLALAALAYVAFTMLLFVMQSRMVFLPHIPGRELVMTPSAYGLPWENVELTTVDGETLHGWWIPAPDATDDTVLFFHGNAGNISHRLESLRIWHGLGLNAFIFDYRGYGRSSGSPGEAGSYLDASATWHYLTGERGIPGGRIVLFGRSLGGAVAIELATRVTPAALIVESTFTSVPDLAAELYPWLPARRLARIKYDSHSRIGAVRAPVMVIHSREDEIIPFHHGARLHEAATGSKHLLELSGDHNTGFLRMGNAYAAGIAEFLE